MNFLPRESKGPLHVPGAYVDGGLELLRPFQARGKLLDGRVGSFSPDIGMLSVINESRLFPKLGYLVHDQSNPYLPGDFNQHQGS